MRKSRLLFLLLLPCAVVAQSDTDFLDLSQAQNAFRRNAKSPALDAQRIINESSSFLKEREPEMTAEEYALYEKVMNMLATNPAFALRVLEGMMNEREKPSPAFEFILGNA
jgi:hypothetical protein